MSTPSPPSRPARGAADVLTLGFAVAVAMWSVGYVGRLPAVRAPGALLLVLFLACVVGGGFLTARLTGRGWLGGAQVGLLSGLVNLMVLGSLLGGPQPNRVAPSAAWWLPGFLVASAALGAAGAAFGSRASPRHFPSWFWAATFVKIAAVATLLLLVVGGMVTSQGAGLAVVDWPSTYGYNMFLFPLSRMTGGIYFEHAHRLFGALVGLTTLVMAVVLQRIEERPWVRRLGWGALVMVAVQGILGGVRVTGRLALGGSTGDASPSITLAVVHGVLAQVFLGTMVALAVFTSRTWRLRGPARVRASARIDRMLCTLLVGLLVTQIALGAAQRHLASGLLVHVAMAAAVTLVAVACGVRAWALNPSEPLLRFLGHAVIEVAVFQVLLGVLAYVVTVPFNWDSTPSPLRVAATTAHQWCGAVLLACAVLLAAWTHRLVRPSSTRAGGGNV